MGGLAGCNDSVRSLKEHYRKAEASAKRQQPARVNLIGGDLPIIFSEADLDGLDLPHNDPLVVTLPIGECNVARVLIDIGSSVDLMYKDTIIKMGIPESEIKEASRTLTAFDNRHITTIGTIKLMVYAGSTTKQVKFMVIDEPSVYNVIIGTPWLHAMRAVASSYHQCVRFPSGGAIFTIKGDQRIARTCFIAERKLRSSSTAVLSILDEKEEDALTQPRPSRSTGPIKSNKELVDMVSINPNHPDQSVSIGIQLEPDLRLKLEDFLRKHTSTFAWTVEDMLGIDPRIASHELNIDPTFKPVRQKRRKLGTERAQAVNEEVDKLLKAGSICEVKYPEWLANPVVVKKKNGKWRVCVDFTDVNKACPKDCFPLPHIDRLVEATAGNELLSFMDAFSGYNQIRMHPNDREKTSFITDRGTYCYKVMPFGLKNAGATYQRLVNKMFSNQLGKTMEVYIDDMLVKSGKAEDHIGHLETCFEILNKYEMKLNPAKCTFGVTSGEFLGYIVTKRGIEANPKQISAVLDLPSPKNKREVQRLSGRIAALNRFIARSTDRCLPFYQLLRSNKTFDWDERCEAAFQELKVYLTTVPILAKPDNGETLYLYIAVSDSAVSGVLVKDDRGEQRPIFYVSKNLEAAEARYTASEKIAFAILTAARKLRPYFQSHPIIVLSDINIRTVLHSPSQSGRLTKWAIELSEYDITYQPRKAHKSQVLADFIVELPPSIVETNEIEQIWELHVDGSVTKNGSGIGMLLRSPTGEVLEQALSLGFPSTNNETEYEALIAGLKLAKGVGVEHIKAYCDSQLVANQYSGDYDAKDNRMARYQKLVQDLAKEFATFELVQISRSENKSADALANLASKPNPYLRTMPIDTIQKPSIDFPRGVNAITDLENELEHEEVMQTDDLARTAPEDDWRTPIIAYLSQGKEPDDKWEARRLKTRAARYTIIRDKLYRWNSAGLLLVCVSKEETEQIIAETHEGEGGNHSGGRALSLKIRKCGHYWPTMVADCEVYAAKCEKCQRHARLINSPTEQLTSGVAPYPFMRWAMDVIGPLPNSHGQKYILVLTDYFTKWVEAKAYPKIESSDVVNFLWKYIICRHGLPYEIVTDNGTNLSSAKVAGFCEKWKIRLVHSTPRYPQGNGQAEATNKCILDGLKKRLGKKKGLWSDELDGVLWSYRTTPRRSTNRSPFSLAHGVEALAPAEAGVYTLRRTTMPDNTGLNDGMLLDSLDDIEELHDQALLRIQNYQQSAARYYNKKVKNRFFDRGDLVLRKVFENTKECNNKMGAKWEGPYSVTKVIKPGVYELETMAGEPIIHPWNSINLKRYYY